MGLRTPSTANPPQAPSSEVAPGPQDSPGIASGGCRGFGGFDSQPERASEVRPVPTGATVRLRDLHDRPCDDLAAAWTYTLGDDPTPRDPAALDQPTWKTPLRPTGAPGEFTAADQ
ncbi:MAG: hypothetical protein ACRDD1_15220 [Planctomycetia bacterium]